MERVKKTEINDLPEQINKLRVNKKFLDILPKKT